MEVSEARGKMMQIVDYDESFAEDFDAYVRNVGLATAGLDYHVASIIGPQSSGKSTLMNLLFGTSFNTMDAAEGRYQVTQGVWLGTDVAAPMIIMDLEGTDSRERGEDALSFERKSALFALALSEVLIVNMWMHDVGRHQAANLALLRTVIELDMQLFMKTSAVYKTKLLFVLRDKDDTPLERLVATLRTDLASIWDSIDKPNAPPGAKLEDYFQMEFAALAHKQYRPEVFLEDVAALKTRFHDGSMFTNEYARGVVADGFSTYAQSVWETVRTNQELDIPSQKKMVATVRCEQIARDCFIAASDQHLAAVKDSLEKTQSPVSDLPATLSRAIAEASDSFTSAASKYDDEVAATKLTDLQDRLANECRDLYEIQSSMVSKNVLEKFSMAIEKQESGKTPWQGFSVNLSNSKNACLAEFDNFCGSNVDSPFNKGSLARANLIETLERQLGRAEKDIKLVTVNSLVKSHRSNLRPTISSMIDKARSEEVWEELTDAVQKAKEDTETRARELLGGSDGLGLEAASIALTVDKVVAECQEAIEEDIRSEIGTVSGCGARLMRRFDESFRFDERGVPRTWRPEEDVDGLYIKSREDAETLISVFSKFSVYSGREEVVIFGPEQRNQLKDLLYQKSSAACMEAKRSQEARSVTSKVPFWLIGVLVVLGWNEFVAVLRNPVLLVLAVLIAPAVYFSYILDLHLMILPLLQPSIDQAAIQAQNLFASYQSSPDTPAESANSTNSTSSAKTEVSDKVSASSEPVEKKEN